MFHQQLQRRAVRQLNPLFGSGNAICILCHARQAVQPSIRRAYAARSPTVRRLESRQKRAPQSKDDLPPIDSIVMLNLPKAISVHSLHSMGIIKSNPDQILAVLRQLEELGWSSSSGKTIDICQSNEVALEDIVPVARACLHPSNPAHIRQVGKRLLLLMSAAGVPEATFRLLRAAMKQDQTMDIDVKVFNSPELAVARLHLSQLVKEQNPTAMVLQAQFLRADKKYPEAIALLESATNLGIAEVPEKGSVEESTLHKGAAAAYFRDNTASTPWQAWTVLGYLYLQVKQGDKARQAFETGAKQGDDPEAYFCLAALVEEFTTEWVTYMTKAAASGQIEAAYFLGMFYLAPLERIPDAKLRDEMRALEKEKPIDWHYRYVTETERRNLASPPPLPLIIGVDKKQAQEKKRLNARTAMAMEWFDLAWMYYEPAAKAMLDLIQQPDAA